MKIACLQYAPKLGAIQRNMERATGIIESTPDLHASSDGRPLWLILPEMSFTGNLVLRCAIKHEAKIYGKAITSNP
jgi:predicted amidohydrolase